MAYEVLPTIVRTDCSSESRPTPCMLTLHFGKLSKPVAPMCVKRVAKVWSFFLKKKDFYASSKVTNLGLEILLSFLNLCRTFDNNNVSNMA
jgi:hypothetical protein